mmetsp:Transcript_3666/g.13169  ORF Transcript_3666/g.13169 Transcript_3666/m.13169 type:complete len:253 (-) Transcript_3666:2017-2775(-)
MANSPFKDTISFEDCFNSFCKLATLSTSSSGFTFRADIKERTIESRSFSSSTTPGPETASIRRMPEAIPCSDSTLKAPISAVFDTCVPPQSSMLTPGTSTTLTSSPYFSPNIATAPAALASSIAMLCVSRGIASPIHPLIRASTCDISSGVTGRGQLKSKRRRSKSTNEPACVIPPSTTSFNADCKRWVDVWFVLARRRRSSSTSVRTLSPTFSVPDSRMAVCRNILPPPAFCTSVTATQAPSAISLPLSPT